MVININLNKKVKSKAVIDTIKYQIKFFYPEISYIKWNNTDITIYTNEKLDYEEVKINIYELIDKFSTVNKSFKKKVFYRSVSDTLFENNNMAFKKDINKICNIVSNKCLFAI